jgi:hypothetical protein
MVQRFRDKTCVLWPIDALRKSYNVQDKQREANEADLLSYMQFTDPNLVQWLILLFCLPPVFFLRLSYYSFWFLSLIFLPFFRSFCLLYSPYLFTSICIPTSFHAILSCYLSSLVLMRIANSTPLNQVELLWSDSRDVRNSTLLNNRLSQILTYRRIYVTWAIKWTWICNVALKESVKQRIVLFSVVSILRYCVPVPLFYFRNEFFTDRLCGLVVKSSWVQLRSCLREIVASPIWKAENKAMGISCADHATPSIRSSWH